MKTWQDIFSEKVSNMNIKEPWMLQEDNTLQVHVLKPGWNEFVQHRALASFQCSQCFHESSSAKAHILFHMCWHQGQGTVWMRTFSQACRRCPDPQLEEPNFRQDSMEKLLHNLVLNILKYFYSVFIQASDLLEVVVDAPVAGPHDRAHCEGCQLGVCSRSRLTLASDAQKHLVDAIKASAPNYQHMRSHATPTHDPLHCNSNLLWKRYYCIGSILLCVLAVLLFVVLYFTMK